MNYEKSTEKSFIFQFLLQLSNDGSGIGAALTVAAAEALSNQEKPKRSYP